MRLLQWCVEKGTTTEGRYRTKTKTKKNMEKKTEEVSQKPKKTKQKEGREGNRKRRHADAGALRKYEREHSVRKHRRVGFAE